MQKAWRGGGTGRPAARHQAKPQPISLVPSLQEIRRQETAFLESLRESNQTPFTRVV